MESFFAALGLVFVAELGDKTQLVALGFGARHRLAPVLAGVVAAYATTNLLSVVVGGLLGAAFPTRAIGLVGGVLFLGFAVWTWRSADEDDDAGADASAGRAGLVSVAVAFFLAELGDKTMLTTAGLAADRGAVPVWVGSFAAMLAATALAVLAGRSLTSRISPGTLRTIGAVAFAVVGVATLASAL